VLDAFGDFNKDNFEEVSGPMSSIVSFFVTLQVTSDSSSEEAV
jgi:hypothetical protein